MIDFKVKADSGDEYPVTATTRDIMQWEKTNKGASFAKLQLEQKMTDLYKIAYIASIRLGLYDGSAVEFESECDLDIVGEDEDAGDPFPKEA